MELPPPPESLRARSSPFAPVNFLHRPQPVRRVVCPEWGCSEHANLTCRAQNASAVPSYAVNRNETLTAISPNVPAGANAICWHATAP